MEGCVDVLVVIPGVVNYELLLCGGGFEGGGYRGGGVRFLGRRVDLHVEEWGDHL